MKIAILNSSTCCYKIRVEDSDWDAQPPESLLWMMQQMILIRRFEETLLMLKGKNLINGPVHTSIGQEGVGVGAAMALNATDKFTGTHRAHHQYLAKVLCAHAPEGFNPLNRNLTEDMREGVKKLLAEIMGLAEGCSGGRGGSMHLFDKAAGVAGTNAIVAGGVAHAAGIAWADRFQGRDDVTVSFLGDGSLYQGVLHEASNLAALWEAPVIYFIENNQYSVGTTLDESCSARNLCEVARAYGMPGVQVDGMNPLAVKLCIESALARRAEGWLPCYIQGDTYRYFHHARGLAGSAFRYRNKDEEGTWRNRDPIDEARRQMQRMGLIDDHMEEHLLEQANRCLDEAVAYCTDQDAEGGMIVRESLWPTFESLTHGLRDDSVDPDITYVEAEDLACTRKIKYSDAIAEVTGHWLKKDPLAFVCGEEVANMGGGAYGATKKLPDQFPRQVLNTPISEAGFCGLACGAAMNGMHPIVEIMFSSFVLVAADQLLNQAGQLGHIYGGHTDVPMVVRTRVATGLGYGAQHSLEPAALFNLFPGWKIYVPTTAFDYVGIFNEAMRSRSPTLIIEHHRFYDEHFMVPEGLPDYLIRPGTAKVIRPGTDVTLAAYSHAAALSLEAADRLAESGIQAEVIDLRALHNAGIDYRTLESSLAKTRRLIIAEQAPASNTLGPKIAVGCYERFPALMSAPPRFVAAPDVPIPVSGRMEQACIPGVDAIVHTVTEALHQQPVLT